MVNPSPSTPPINVVYCITNLILLTISMHTKLFKSFLFLSFSAVIISLSRFTLRAVGDSNPLFCNVLTVSFFISLLLGSKRRYYLLMLPISIIVAAYAPIGFTYGFPSYQYVASLFATDIQESVEFLSLIPYKSYIYAISIPFLFAAIYILSLRLNFRPLKNRAYVITGVVFLTISSGAIVFIKKTEDAVTKVRLEMNELSKYAKRNDWLGIHQTEKTKYDYYVLVIGESARRDYFHAYGYPVKNTEFIDSTKGIIVNGLDSAGVYTIGSLRLMLTQGDKLKWQPNYNMNIMGMANKAGFETYWLSNQGQFGKWDSPISSIAKMADESYFTKSQDYNEKNIPDSLLIKKLKQIIAKNTNKKRFIVLHTMGSHPSACDRVSDMRNQIKVKSDINKYIACYVSSIKQTDEFLKSVYETMSQSENVKKFSIIYFSDHGMVHREMNGRIYLNNNYISKYHHDIPLIKISSDDIDRKEVSSKKSGLMFVNGLANWMGVEGKSINSYNLFDGIPSSQDYGLSKQDYKVDDPAIDITSDLEPSH